MRVNKPKQPLKKGVAKVPVVVQMEALECGAACLTMILAYYGKWIPLEQVRSDCGVSRDGTKAINVLKAARGYGLKANGYRYEPDSLRKSGKFPCIIHWNFNHFVVLNGFRGNKAYLNDPANGTYSVPMELFNQSFTGICLFFEPGEEFVPSGKPKSTLAFAKKRLKGASAAVVFVVLTSAIVSFLNAVSPAFSRVFLDRLLTGQNPDWLGPFLVGLSLLTAITLLVSWIQAVYILKLNGKLAIVANSTYMWHVLRLPMTFFSQRLAGDIAMRQSLNEEIAATLIHTLTPLVLQSGMMILYLLVMIRYSWLLTLIGVFSILINLFIAQILSQKRVNITRVQMRDQGKLAAATVAGIEMIETIKASGAENGFFERWAGFQANTNAQMVKFERIDQHLGMIPSMVTSLTNVAVLVLGVYLTFQGEFTVGMILAFQGFLLGFSAPANALIEAGQTVQEMRANMERVEDVLEYPADVHPDGAPADGAVLNKLTGNVEMKNVTFGYSRLAPPLIEQFDLHVKQGQRVAFVGASGCGKSTMARLLSGLYTPWNGEILFDGQPISGISHSVFTGSLAVVDQDIVLFEDTIANNIKMWDNSIDNFEVILAARDASLHGDIMEREGGYNHPLTEGGHNLSGGQRQRMEIARVLAQDPTILILDEATSALDAQTEFEVMNAIKARGITCIVIAHRLSTIRDCDEIVVMDKGKVVERGTHEQLFAAGGLYAALVSNE